MKLFVPLLLVAALGGCTTAKMTVTPDGRRGVSIDCSGSSAWSGCYEKAGQMCPGGYVVFSKDGDDGNAIAVGNKNGFTSTQMASLASGGVRPGEMQLDPNARPNTYLSQFYPTPSATKPDFSLRSAVTLNGLSAMSTFNTYVDPLLLDLTGNGVHMTDIRRCAV